MSIGYSASCTLWRSSRTQLKSYGRNPRVREMRHVLVDDARWHVRGQPARLMDQRQQEAAVRADVRLLLERVIIPA